MKRPMFCHRYEQGKKSLGNPWRTNEKRVAVHSNLELAQHENNLAFSQSQVGTLGLMS